ncbi:MAG: hypothetical protein ACOC6F_01900 [bacterium]
MASKETEAQVVGETAFPGDDHQRMKRIQWGLAPALIHHLVSEAARAYKQAMLIIGRGTELWERFAPFWTGGYDALVLLEPYRLIAAYYRFAHDPRGQLHLLPIDETQEQIMREKWTEYFYQESRRLLEWRPALHRLILQAVVYDGTPDCEPAVKSIASMLLLRYGEERFPG